MSWADAVVVPSMTPETGPYTVLEAQLAGAAVIGSDLGGIGERLRDEEHGYTFRRGDSEALARTIGVARSRRLTSGERAARAAAWASAHSRRFASELDSLLAELAQQRPARDT